MSVFSMRFNHVQNPHRERKLTMGSVTRQLRPIEKAMKLKTYVPEKEDPRIFMEWFLPVELI